jgi:hypothetical protein
MSAEGCVNSFLCFRAHSEPALADWLGGFCQWYTLTGLCVLLCMCVHL